MVFSDHTDKKQNIIQQIIQNGVYAPTVSDSRKLSKPLYGKRVLQSVKTMDAIAIHSGCLVKIKAKFNIFSPVITGFSLIVYVELLLSQPGKPYACIWFLNLAKLKLFALASMAF